jgi:hypothetical protein
VSGPVSTLRASAALVALQALGLVAVAVLYLVELVVSSSDDPARALVTVALALLAAVGLGLVARGLLAGRRWARSPALVTNLILLPVAFGLLQGSVWYVGIPLLLWALAVLVLLFAPATSAALDED